MNIRSWWNRTLRKQRGNAPAGPTTGPRRPELREFAYLDEVSLRSLLSSQKGGMTDLMSEQAVEAREASVAGTVGANPGVIAKAEVTSRFQTTNSSTIQTSRKATVQSWFRELHDIKGLRIIEPATAIPLVSSIEDVMAIEDGSLLCRAEGLRRGMLIEMKVRLAADPVFHLGTMVSEFAAMAEDYPDMFAGGNGLARLDEAKPVNKVLQRLLAGLVPVRAIATDYVVIEFRGVEYLVNHKLVANLGIRSRPLEIVGVTEHEAYWKDLRRVLFSDAEFTVLARISRSGLYDSWTPVKLADLFLDVAPGLVEQINAAGRVPFASDSAVPGASAAESRLGAALAAYADAYLAELGATIDAGQRETLEGRIVDLKTRVATVSDQRAAFGEVSRQLCEMTHRQLDPARALELREASRQAHGLPLFPALAGVVEPVSMARSVPEEDRRLLDVDFVAIYW